MTETFLFLLLSTIENEAHQRLLAELYGKYQKQVGAYIRRRFQINPEDADDCVQQCYLNIARNIEKVATLDSRRQIGYLLKTAFTVAAQFLVKKQRFPIVDAEGEEMDNLIYTSGNRPVPSAEAVVRQRGVLQAFNERLAELTPTEQIVFQLYFIEGISREELAKRLNVSVNSVRTYISRTKAHGEKILKEVYYEQ